MENTVRQLGAQLPVKVVGQVELPQDKSDDRQQSTKPVSITLENEKYASPRIRRMIAELLELQGCSLQHTKEES